MCFLLFFILKRNNFNIPKTIDFYEKNSGLSGDFAKFTPYRLNTTILESLNYIINLFMNDKFSLSVHAYTGQCLTKVFKL